MKGCGLSVRGLRVGRWAVVWWVRVSGNDYHCPYCNKDRWHHHYRNQGRSGAVVVAGESEGRRHNQYAG